MPSIKNIPAPDRPADALAAVVALRRMADMLERQAVRNAIDQGWTWTRIAEALGITRQAAHKRLASIMKKKAAPSQKKDVVHV